MAYYPTSQNLAIVPEPAQHVVVASPVHPAEKNKNAFTIIGICQLLIGIICAIIGGVLASHTSPTSTSNTGIGAGVLYAITGGLALATGAGPTSCNVVGGMVMAILSSLSAGITAAFAAFALAELDSLEYSYYTEPSSVIAIIGTICGLCFLEFFLAIVHSAYCCSGSCCARTNQPGMVLQIPQPHAAPPAYGQTKNPYKPFTNEPEA
ncbi:uncharacterized protein LOC120336271 [Styela clava]